jgi:hypothetical protein
MNVYIIVLAVLFAINFALMVYYNKLFWLKISTVTILFIIVNMLYFSFDSIKGWPSSDTVKKGQLVFVEVLEPNGSYPGAVYLYVKLDNSETVWYNKYISYNYWDSNAPRSFYLPYTDETGKKMREAKDAIEKGYIVEISESGIETEQNSEGEDNGNGTEQGTPSDSANINVPHLKLVDPRERSGKKTP